MTDFKFDLATGIAGLIFGNLVSFVLGIAYQTQRKRDRAINVFLLSKGFEMVAWVLIGLRGTIDEAFSVLAGNVFLVIGTALQARTFLDIKCSYNELAKKLYLTLTVLAVIMAAAMSFLYPSPNKRITVMAVITIALWAYPTYVLLTKKPSSSLQKFIGTTLMLGLLPYVYNAIRGWQHGDDAFLITGSLADTPFFMSLYMFLFVGNMGVLLLSKEASDVLVAHAAAYDELTGIYNRRTFASHMEQGIRDMESKAAPLSFIIMDLDHFKTVNDTYGHFVGDQVLRAFADTVKANLRQNDIFGRFGGEEFTLLLPQTDARQAHMVADRIRAAAEQNTVNGQVHYTVSIGVATVVPNALTTMDALYKAGDKALYSAKNNGRNCISVLQS